LNSLPSSRSNCYFIWATARWS